MTWKPSGIERSLASFRLFPSKNRHPYGRNCKIWPPFTRATLEGGKTSPSLFTSSSAGPGGLSKKLMILPLGVAVGPENMQRLGWLTTFEACWLKMVASMALLTWTATNTEADWSTWRRLCMKWQGSAYREDGGTPQKWQMPTGKYQSGPMFSNGGLHSSMEAGPLPEACVW